MSQDNVILSADVNRAERIPPRQALTRKWPVLHYGATPAFDRSHWTFHIFGLVEKPSECSYDEFIAVPHVQVRADMHCVTRWSKLDNLWEGVSTPDVFGKVNVLPEAKFVMVHCEHGFTTNLPLADFLEQTPQPHRTPVIYKSIGSVEQDLSLAVATWQEAERQGIGEVIEPIERPR